MTERATKTALIAGATGATAVRLVDLLAADPDWQVIGVCRKPPAITAGVRYIAADLTSREAAHAALAGATSATHVFYCCRAPHGESGTEDVAGNVAMLRNVVDAVEQAAPGLAHVHLIEGGKWYGMHLGAFPTPAREDDARHPPPNFYYDQQDWLTARQHGKAWTWSASRPNFITDFAPERARNLVPVLGAYAAVCREMGEPLHFPGTPGAFAALAELTDATHFARALRQIATTPACRNAAFNVTDGEPIRWQRFWPQLADHFAMTAAGPRPVSLADWMADKEPVWQRIVARHGLQPQSLADTALWPFADFALNQSHDVFFSAQRLRATGFTETVDTHARLLAHIDRYRAARLLP